MAGTGGCNSNISGKISATGTGDLTAPPMPRMASESVGPCGETEVTSLGKDLLRRLPYLQQVTSSSATVVWTSADGDGPADVVVTEPDGTVLQRLEATIDTTAPLPYRSRQWTATADGLRPGATVCYEIRHADGPVVTGGSITTAPLPGTGAPVRILALGDSGEGGSDQHALLAQIDTVPFDLMIHTGDIAYDHGTLGDFETQVLRRVRPAAGPRADVPGQRQPRIRNRGRRPVSPGLRAARKRRAGRARALVLVRLGRRPLRRARHRTDRTRQAEWLEADLAANRLPWTIVYGHRPPHSPANTATTRAFGSSSFRSWKSTTWTWCWPGTTITTNGSAPATA